MSAYYNEFDPYAAAWIRNLIAAGLVAPGDVDERSIEDVAPDDIKHYRQVHLFAGIAVWSHAARLAGIGDDEPLWSASCPCQPFSAAGKGGGFADERHLWPAVLHLVQALRPERIVGEQVSSKDGLGWFDLVQTDLEASGYAVGAIDTCSAGVGAPNIRQRLYWMADAGQSQRGRRAAHGRGDLGDGTPTGWIEDASHTERGSAAGGVADAHGGQSGCAGRLQSGGEHGQQPQDGGAALWMADANHPERRPEPTRGHHEHGPGAGWPQGTGDAQGRGHAGGPGPVNGFWRDADWLACRDGKWRPVEPGSFPLATGAPTRVGRLRAYGNAINAQVAAEFLRCMP